MRRGMPGRSSLILSILLVAGACGDDGGGGPDDEVVTTEHCDYQPLPATTGAGGTVEAGALEAGAAEAILPGPVGAALGAYTARAGFLGSAGSVDNRESELSGNFNPSIGYETLPRVRAVALSAGGETVVIMKVDLGAVFEGMIFDLEERLDMPGKVLISASHTHSGWGHFTAHSAYQVGFGVYRQTIYDAFLDAMEQTAQAALDARRPAKIGFYVDTEFDPMDAITRDRRGENDELMGGPRKDDHFFLLRIDGTDDEPIAIVPVYGVHGTLHGEDNGFASTDSIGGMERVLEETFDDQVVVMHLQGAGGDVSPTPAGGLDCSQRPGDDPEDPCVEWLRAEAHGRIAAAAVRDAWTAAGDSMQTELAIEMLTRSVELGPYHDTFTIRDGALEYAPFDQERPADGEILDGDGNIISPIDEFNAPVGAGLCEKQEIMFGAGTMPGTDDLYPYASCARVAAMSEIFEILLDTTFESDETHPICGTTRTNLSALRLGDYVVGTIPGEPNVMLADLVREKSPVAGDKTIVVGYAQGHMGYALTPEDWIAGGYEASINIWGPLEGEYLVERLAELMPLAMSSEREDGAADGTDRWVHPAVTDELPIDDPAPMAGTTPDPVPEEVYVRTGTPASAQPPASIERVSGIATFVFIGDDPLVATPVVTLEREVATDDWQTVTRRSGRTLRDGAIVVAYTPLPVRRDGDQPQTHYWAVEMQAVPFLGATDAAGMPVDGDTNKAAFPLGRYRFRVAGDSFEITSDPFEVTEADLDVNVARSGTSYEATVSIHAPEGYRLLDYVADSNHPVPTRGATYDVSLALSGGGTADFTDQVADDNGTVTVDAAGDADDVVSVTLTDPYGNSRTVSVNQ